MRKYKLGDRVRIISMALNDYKRYIGETGFVTSYGLGFPYHITLSGSTKVVPVHGYEIELIDEVIMPVEKAGIDLDKLLDSFR